MGEQLFLRLANESDMPIIMSWRSNPLIYKSFYTQKNPLTWDEHCNWWATRPSSWCEFIIVLNQDSVIRDIGVVSIGQLEHWSPEIGYFIGEVSLWNKGYGTKAVSLAIDWLKEHEYKHCHTTVLKSNLASIRLLEKCGFTEGQEAREGELWYHKRL